MTSLYTLRAEGLPEEVTDSIVSAHCQMKRNTPDLRVKGFGWTSVYREGSNKYSLSVLNIPGESLQDVLNLFVPHNVRDFTLTDVY